MQQFEFDAEFFAMSDGKVAVIVYSVKELPRDLEELRQLERRPPRRVVDENLDKATRNCDGAA